MSRDGKTDEFLVTLKKAILWQKWIPQVGVVIKRTRCQKKQEAVYPCGSDAYGGPGISFDHFLHFYHDHELAYGYEAQSAQGYG